MQKYLAAILCSLLLPVGVAMAMTACDKKEDNKGGKDGGKGRPVVIIVWDEAWTPIIR